MTLKEAIELEKENEGLTSINEINDLRTSKGLAELTLEQIESISIFIDLKKNVKLMVQNLKQQQKEIKFFALQINKFFENWIDRTALELRQDFDNKYKSYKRYFDSMNFILPEDYKTFFIWYINNKDNEDKELFNIKNYESQDFIKYHFAMVTKFEAFIEIEHSRQSISNNSSQKKKKKNNDAFIRLSQVAFYCYCMEIEVTNGNQDKILEEVKSKFNLTSPKLTNSDGTFKEHYDDFKHSRKINKNLEADKTAVLNVLLSLNEEKAYQKAFDYSPKVYKND